MNNYTENLRKLKSLLIVTSLQKRRDVEAFNKIKKIDIELKWQPLSNLLIENDVWDYVVKTRQYEPKYVFCHPDIIIADKSTSLYYRGLCGLSMKAAKDYFGAIEKIESGNKQARLGKEKALRIARIYNMFICSIIKGSYKWTLENGKRTLIATLGITLDGIMRNRVGALAEERIRTMVFEWLIEKGLIMDEITEIDSNEFELKDDIIMRFSSEPDIYFTRKSGSGEELLALIEIKGGIDPAGALERYGAATKSFQQALKENPRCKNFFLTAVFTQELLSRIKGDRLVEKYYDIVKILEDPKVKDDFFDELFHYTLRLI
ncbi:MAG: XcyI family restriction endonuclease [Bacteroidales bacterium]|nr:XcyI family restriction endonuclease [Bacteroidales bacterium]